MQNIDLRLKITGIGLSLTAICAQLGVLLIDDGGAI